MRDDTFTYSMSRACGVVFEDKIHLFGGELHDGEDFTKQHIGFDASRNFVQYKQLGKKAYKERNTIHEDVIFSIV